MIGVSAIGQAIDDYRTGRFVPYGERYITIEGLASGKMVKFYPRDLFNLLVDDQRPPVIELETEDIELARAYLGLNPDLIFGRDSGS